MDPRSKRKLFQAIRDALLEARVDLNYVHFQYFHRQSDSRPDLARFVIISLEQILRKVERARPGKQALWVGSDRFRVVIRDTRNVLPRVPIAEARAGGFRLSSIIAVVSQYVAGIQTWTREEADKRAAEAASSDEADKIIASFDLEGFTHLEQVGWRRNLPAIAVDSYADGLTVEFHRRLTPKEARAILSCARDLGLLPGGVREKDRPPARNAKNRFERL